MAIGDSTRINTNIGALNALSSLKSINKSLERSQLKLATGSRINEVSDDPAGFVISRKLSARVRGLGAALDNVGTAKNLLAIAEGGLENISEILITMKEKVTQAASDSLSSSERNAISTELNQLVSEISNIVEETSFNNVALLDGTYTGKSFQTGAGTTNTFSLSLSLAVTPTGLSVTSSDVSSRVFTATGASSALASVDAAIETVSDQMQQVGSNVSRLSIKESTLSIAITNNEAAKARISDADFAKEQLESTRLLILQQTSTAQLAQANITPQNVLALFV
jgi:flagellin